MGWRIMLTGHTPGRASVGVARGRQQMHASWVDKASEGGERGLVNGNAVSGVTERMRAMDSPGRGRLRGAEPGTTGGLGLVAGYQ